MHAGADMCAERTPDYLLAAAALIAATQIHAALHRQTPQSTLQASSTALHGTASAATHRGDQDAAQLTPAARRALSVPPVALMAAGQTSPEAASNVSCCQLLTQRCFVAWQFDYLNTPATSDMILLRLLRLQRAPLICLDRC